MGMLACRMRDRVFSVVTWRITIEHINSINVSFVYPMNSPRKDGDLMVCSPSRAGVGNKMMILINNAVQSP